jgi:FKBP-type peptidyl-prolyl cis-trans isomerase SlyD
MAVHEIKNDVVVSIAYKMYADGDLVEETEGSDPLEYLHGHENIVPGLERALDGKKIGDRLTVTLQPEDAYGEYDEDAIELIDASELPDDIEPGMELVLEDEDGNFYDVVVRELTDEGVVLDFNPPFAGQEITYDVEVIALREANEDELDHGHPHTYEYEE